MWSPYSPSPTSETTGHFRLPLKHIHMWHRIISAPPSLTTKRLKASGQVTAPKRLKIVVREQQQGVVVSARVLKDSQQFNQAERNAECNSTWWDILTLCVYHIVIIWCGGGVVALNGKGETTTPPSLICPLSVRETRSLKRFFHPPKPSRRNQDEDSIHFGWEGK